MPSIEEHIDERINELNQQIDPNEPVQDTSGSIDWNGNVTTDMDKLYESPSVERALLEGIRSNF